ncbi:hypothetical protein GY45DRAFT_377135 [Cubamyces sp. BRFM 1775]|nr:hypothetical protein GY45DRAFT_377135 [Cubamyces sp. BRFM 1775]
MYRGLAGCLWPPIRHIPLVCPASDVIYAAATWLRAFPRTCTPILSLVLLWVGLSAQYAPNATPPAPHSFSATLGKPGHEHR